MDAQAINKAVEILKGKNNIAVLSGAGISVPSGIPDFRSAGGVWDRYDIEEYASVDSFLRDPAKVWKLFDEFDSLIGDANPNSAHTALVELERAELLKGIITQNIDGLHQKAGSRKVVDFHGNVNSMHCINCRWEEPRKERYRAAKEKVPLCPRCGAPVKPAVVLFGEQIPRHALNTAFILTEKADAFLVIGTSAMVAPASMFADMAHERGIPVIELNLVATQLTGRAATVSLLGDAAEVAPALVKALLG